MKNQIIYTSILAVVLVYLVTAFVEASFTPFLWPRDTRILAGCIAAGAILFFVFAYSVQEKIIDAQFKVDRETLRVYRKSQQVNSLLISALEFERSKNKTGTPAPEQ